MKNLFLLSFPQTMDFISLWGEAISNNDDKQVANIHIFNKIASQLNIKYQINEFMGNSLLKKSSRMKRSYTIVSLKVLYFMLY